MHCVQYALIYDYLQLMPQYEIAECVMCMPKYDIVDGKRRILYR